MSSAGELLRSKRLPELSLAASRAVAEANPGPVEESCPHCWFQALSDCHVTFAKVMGKILWPSARAMGTSITLICKSDEKDKY